MPIFELSDNEISFPLPELARDDGLLAIGGDLSKDRLVLAYSHGIFPWYNYGDPILWWCPKERYIIRPENIHVSHSMKKFMRKHEVHVELNRDFSDTMHRCRMKREAKEEGTWINPAISVEGYIDGVLSGGLYGVSLGKCFFGESMFSDLENGSKIALIGLAQILEENGYVMIDCQFYTDHLESMGGEYISYAGYKELLHEGGL